MQKRAMPKLWTTAVSGGQHVSSLIIFIFIFVDTIFRDIWHKLCIHMLSPRFEVLYHHEKTANFRRTYVGMDFCLTNHNIQVHAAKEGRITSIR